LTLRTVLRRWNRTKLPYRACKNCSSRLELQRDNATVLRIPISVEANNCNRLLSKKAIRETFVAPRRCNCHFPPKLTRLFATYYGGGGVTATTNGCYRLSIGTQIGPFVVVESFHPFSRWFLPYQDDGAQLLQNAPEIRTGVAASFVELTGLINRRGELFLP
jgi:hypothetical protein